MNSVPGRIQYDNIRLVRKVIDYLKHITAYKFAIGYTVSLSILYRSFHGFGYYLYPVNLACGGCRYLGDGTCSAVKIVNCLAIRSAAFFNILSYHAVQNFRAV